MGLSAGDVFLDVHPNLTSFNRELATRMGGLRGAAEGILKPFGLSLGTALTGGAAIAIGKFVGSSIDAFKQAEQISAQTGAVIESTGGAANVSAEQVDTLANSLADLVGTDDEAVQASENLLLTFRQIADEEGPENTFERTERAVLDMATAMNSGAIPTLEDLRSTTIQVGKAVNDPIKGLTALQRVGVTFTEAQREQIDAMLEANDLMGAQDVIPSELEAEFGGAAEAAGNTFAGAMGDLSREFGNLEEAVGEKAVRPLRLFVSIATVAVKNIEAIGAALLTFLALRSLPKLLFAIGVQLVGVGSAGATAGEGLAVLSTSMAATPALALSAAAAIGILVLGLNDMAGTSERADAGLKKLLDETVRRFADEAYRSDAALIRFAADFQIASENALTTQSSLDATQETIKRLRGEFEAGTITQQEFGDALSVLGLDASDVKRIIRETANAADDLTFSIDKSGNRVRNFAGLTHKELKEFRTALVQSVQVTIGQFDKLSDAFATTPRELARQARQAVEIARRQQRDLGEILGSKDLSDKAKRALASLPPDLRDAWARAGKAQKEQIARDAVELQRLNDRAAARIGRALKGQLQKGGTEAGKGLGDGLVAGIESQRARVEAAARAIAQEAVNAAKDELDISSPSGVFQEIGEQVVQGLIRGFDRSSGKLRDSIDELVNLIRDAARNGLPRAHLELAEALADTIASTQRSFDKLLEQTSSHLEELRQTVSDFRDDIVSGFADVSDLVGGLISLGSDTEGGLTTQAIQDFLGQQLAEAQAFSSGLEQLSAMGLSPEALAQLASQGPEALPLIQALIAGGGDLIATFNATAAQLAEIADQTATELTDAAFGEELAAAAEALERLQNRIERVIGRLQHRVENLIDGIRAEAVASQIDGLLDALRRLERRLDLNGGSGGAGGGNGGSGGAGGGGGGGGGNAAATAPSVISGTLTLTPDGRAFVRGVVRAEVAGQIDYLERLARAEKFKS